jgi:hypothetical protein
MRIFNDIRVKIDAFMNYLKVSKIIAEDIVKNKKKIREIDDKIMKYREEGKTINDIKNDIEKGK